MIINNYRDYTTLPEELLDKMSYITLERKPYAAAQEFDLCNLWCSASHYGRTRSA